MIINRKIKDAYWAYRMRNRTKIFCIGRNKTGTTSLAKAFKQLGLRVGRQKPAQLLVREYVARDFAPIIDYCRTAEVFQDAPFSFPETFKYLDAAYPGSKFVLTLRDSPYQWYESLVKFHAIRFGNGRVPTADDLKNAPNLWKGRAWETNRALYDSPEDDPYNKEILIAHYVGHKDSILEYFRERPDDLIVINVGIKSDYSRLMDFLGFESPYEDFPWENATKDCAGNDLDRSG